MMTSSSGSGTLFEDMFAVDALNINGKKFERVNRLHCKSSMFEVDMVLDTNSELFDIKSGERCVALFTSSLTGAAEGSSYNPSAYANSTLLDEFDYAMHGRVFGIKHISQTGAGGSAGAAAATDRGSAQRLHVEVQISFGGLLCRLRGEQAQLGGFEMDMMVYILLRKGVAPTAVTA